MKRKKLFFNRGRLSKGSKLKHDNLLIMSMYDKLNGEEKQTY